MSQNYNLNNSPMRFMFHTVLNKEKHYHEDVELLYVFDGIVEVKIENKKYKLKPDDFLIINSNKSHTYLANDKALFASFYVSYVKLIEMANETNIMFYCNSTIDKSSAYNDVRDSIKELVNIFFENSRVEKIRLISQYYYILYQILNNFALTSKDIYEDEVFDQDKERIQKIVRYISTNYYNKLSLKDLADLVFLSEAYLSKYIKKHLGMNFLDYVNNIRLNHALSDLLYSDLPIIRIALDNGFPSVAAFTKPFKAKYKITPTKYKENYEINQNSEQLNEIQERVKKCFLMNPYKKPKAETHQEYRINIDNIKSIVFEKPWNKMLNMGTAVEILNSNMQEHIIDIKNGLRFKYVRIWDLYSPEMYIDINAKNKHYNFDKLNRVLDFLVLNDIYPYIELNVKPKKLIQDIGKVLIVDDKSLCFDSLEALENFIEAFILHLINRYGTEQISNWYFEFWKEDEDGKPSCKMEMGNSLERYFQEFNIVCATLKKYFPDIQVGGAGLSIRYGENALLRLFKMWKLQTYQPDFVTFYCFPYVLGNYEGKKINKISTDREYLKNYIETAKEIMKNADFSISQLHISEWNSTISNRNILNDSCYKGAYIIKNLIDSVNEIDVLGYWFGSDLYADFYDSNLLLNGGSGLLSKDGIPKPAYYAIQFMNRLGKKFIIKDNDYILTETGFEEWRIVCHNYKFLNYKYFMTNEDDLDLYNLDLLFEDLETKELKFNITGLKNGSYEIRTYSINKQYGSVQDEWIRMSCPNNLTIDELNYIKQICVPRLSINIRNVELGQLKFDTKLETNEIQLITIKYQYEKQ